MNLKTKKLSYVYVNYTHRKFLQSVINEPIVNTLEVCVVYATDLYNKRNIA